VVPRIFVVFTVEDTVAPRTARPHTQGRPSLCDAGHGDATDGHLAVLESAASAATADPESPLEPPDRLMATGEPVTAIAEPYEGVNVAGGTPEEGAYASVAVDGLPSAAIESVARPTEEPDHVAPD
jgi:hypothetical protein